MSKDVTDGLSAHPSFISVNKTPAMSGYFATLYSWSTEDFGSFYEPYDTGMGRYPTRDEAIAEAREWAADMGVEYRP